MEPQSIDAAWKGLREAVDDVTNAGGVKLDAYQYEALRLMFLLGAGSMFKMVEQAIAEQTADAFVETMRIWRVEVTDCMAELARDATIAKAMLSARAAWKKD